MRRKAAIVFLALLCFTLGLVTAFYFPIPARVGAVVTKLLQGKIRPFSVKRNFNEIIAYVTDRKAGPTVGYAIDSTFLIAVASIGERFVQRRFNRFAGAVLTGHKFG